MKEFIKAICGVSLLVLYVVGLWVIGSRVGVELLVVLWNAGMQWEACVVGFIVWDWLITAVLNLILAILKTIKEVM